MGCWFLKAWVIRYSGNLVHCCEWRQKFPVRVTVFTADVSLLNDFSVFMSGDLV